MDEATKKIIREKLIAANIGKTLWQFSLPNLGNAGKALRGLIDSGEFTEAVYSGQTYFIAGEAARIDVFNALAKEATIMGMSVFLTSTRQILSMLQFNDRVSLLHDVSILFIKDFYDDTAAYPFQEYDRMLIEEILSYRVDEGKSTFLCSSVPAAKVKWWSTTILHRLHTNVREFYVGKSNGRD